MRECSRRAGQAVNGYLDWGRRNRDHVGVREAPGRTRASPRGL